LVLRKIRGRAAGLSQASGSRAAPPRVFDIASASRQKLKRHVPAATPRSREVGGGWRFCTRLPKPHVNDERRAGAIDLLYLANASPVPFNKPTEFPSVVSRVGRIAIPSSRV